GRLSSAPYWMERRLPIRLTLETVLGLLTTRERAPKVTSCPWCTLPANRFPAVVAENFMQPIN
ncbi:hypothetical protein BaRGS_00024546, partial [Batillaria attramentaria]